MTNKKNAVYDTDVEGVSMKTLEAGLWWTKNKNSLRTTLIIFLCLVSICSWGYTLYGFGYYLLVGMNADEQMAKSVVQTTVVDQNYLQQSLPKKLELSPVGYIADNGKYDLYVQITNPNSAWWTTFSYCFKRLDGEQSCGNAFILPGDKKYILSLGQIFNADPNDLTFSYNNEEWNRIDRHAIADWNTFSSNHLNIAFTDQTFTPASSNAVSEKVSLNTLTFKAFNNSAYSFWELPLSIVLTDNGRIVYLDRYQLSNFNSNETRNVQITWPGTIGEATGISITPDVNILDGKVFQQPK